MPLPDAPPVQDNPYGPLVSFKHNDILPPTAVYVAPTDQIFIQLLHPTTGVGAVTVTTRFLRASDGVLVTSSTTQTFNTPAFPDRMFLPPSEGFLLALMVQAGNASRGQLYCRVFFNQSQDNTVRNLTGLLCQGYVSTTDFLVYPGSVFESSLNGTGWLRTVSQAAQNQAPNIITVPANVHWKLRCVNFTYSCSATVANRSPFVAVFDAGGNQLFFQMSSLTLTANNTGIMAFAGGLTHASQSNTESNGLAIDLVLTPGFTVEGTALVISAGDQVGPMILTFEEFVGL